jgi:23S rRNA (adenine2503-C2)-methyltransferase
MPLTVLNSQIDRSVNFVEEQLVGFIESRFVRKYDDYFIAYLSSQTGCNRGCTFCHLTATGQTSFVDSSHNDFMAQAIQIFKHYRKEKKPARYMHYNFYGTWGATG